MYIRECPGCHVSFETRDIRQKRCKPNCRRKKTQTVKASHAARTVRREEHRLEFIGVDGEGINHEDGGHDYVLISCGDRSLHRDGAALRFEDILTFLWECFQANPGAVFVGYFLGYDFTHWLRSLPENRARILLSKQGKLSRARTQSGRNTVPFPVEYAGWEFDILGTKRFKLRPRDAKQWMYVCDAGSYFQSSFLKAINPADWPTPVCSAEEYETILTGKSERASATLDDAMVRYNIAENRVLSRLMARLNEGFVSAGVILPKQKWFGPGQAAQAWLNLIDAPKGHEIRAVVPINAMEAARDAYYGGWFEIFAHGLVAGKSWEYDINSAYPHVISRLPCLLHGEWRTETTATLPVDKRWLLVSATVQGKPGHRIGTMLHRTPRGVICRPGKTRGWFWWHELDAARRAGTVTNVRVTEWVQYTPCDCPPPFEDIAELYRRRLSVGKNTPEGMVLKLLYNSCYGKMAQSIGSPIYSCSIYASLITAGCRTQILDAIATHPVGMEDVLMIATDGIYFRTRHTRLDIDGERLGAWDEKCKENLSLFMPGVYWDDKSRAKIRAGEAPELKSRGISAQDLAGVIADIDAAWLEWSFGTEPPTMEIPIRFTLVTATQALARGKWETCGRVTSGDMRKISADPHNKRAYMDWDPERGYIRSMPYLTPWEGPIESTPYSQLFGMEEIDYNEDYNWETPDGSINGIFADALKGE